MPDAAVGAYFHQSPDIEAVLTAKVSLNPVLFVYDLPDAGQLLLGQLFNTGIALDGSLLGHLHRKRWANAVDIAQSYVHTLLVGHLCAGYTRHTAS
jgi:hypothetical protein